MISILDECDGFFGLFYVFCNKVCFYDEKVVNVFFFVKVKFVFVSLKVGWVKINFEVVIIIWY